MSLFAWFTFLVILGLYYRFLSLLFRNLNGSRIVNIFCSVVGFFFTFVIAKVIQLLLSVGQSNSGTNEAVNYFIWFGITIGLIIIYEAILRMIIVRKEFQKIQIQRKLEEVNSLMYKVDEYIKRGDWKQAQQIYDEIEAFDITQTEMTLRCLEFAEKHESIGNLAASQFWYEKVR